MRLRAVIAIVLFSFIATPACPAIEIQFDRSFDTNGFFANPTAMAALEAAADVYETLLIDDLSAIVPDGGQNTWLATFQNPSTGSPAEIRDLVVPADTIIVYVGARNMSSLEGDPISQVSNGGVSLSNATPQWAFSTVLERGEGPVIGSAAHDYATWGGSIAFNSAATWHRNPETNPIVGANDLYSAAVHELAYILGFGRKLILDGQSTSWTNLVTDGRFEGPMSVTEYGSSVPLVDLPNEAAYWAPDIPSVVYGTSTSQNAALDEGIELGTREHLTQLDAAALVDIGWLIEQVLGDYNLDGAVNTADYVVWRNTFGSSTDLRADGSGNNLVGQEDFDVWANQMRSGSSQAVASAAPLDSIVPEPATLNAALTAAALFCFARRRRQ